MIATLISHYFVKYDRHHTVNILTESYAKWTVDEKIRESVKQEIETMPQTQPLIILQYRYSSHANKTQNIGNITIYTQLEKYLKSKGYAIWYLFVDLRSKYLVVLKIKQIGVFHEKPNSIRVHLIFTPSGV